MRGAALPAACLAFALALWLRVHNALGSPPDWGYDASFSWQYIEALRRVWHLPRPDAGWATSDPPLYYALAAGLMRLVPAPALVPWLNTLLGLGIAGCAVWLVRRLAPGDGARALLAAGLVLYLPAHVHMSAMVNKEMLASAFIALAIAAAADPARAHESPRAGLWRALGVGVAAGLALLSKLSGLLVTPASAVGWLYDARRGRAPWLPAALCCAVAAAVGGWFYLHNRIAYGYFQPHDLAIHGQLMWGMPPGRRELADYLRFPLAGFADPQALNPALLRSVWGTTYASVWFDAHRMFLPTHDEGVRRLGTVTLTLALLPTAAFLAGLFAGLRRILRGDGACDAPLCALVALTLAGYALFAWQNPYFAVLKGTSLLGLCVPYAVYTSEALCRWSRRGRAHALAIAVLLAALAVCVIAGSAFRLVYVRTENPGIPWGPPVPS